jgi:hypothetical protein
MPDLQTEMQKILHSWEQPETTEEIMFTPTTNTSRATFNFIRDNAGCTQVHAIQKLVQQGHKKSSVGALIGQMIRQGHVTKNNYGMLYPNATEYKPLKAAKTIANQEAKVKKAKTSKVITSKPTGINALIADHKEAVRHIESRNNVESILDNISLSDAHELYRKLHQYFGGLPK